MPKAGKAPSDRPAFQPYRGKPAVRNSKVYVIIHDSTDVLVCGGGNVGGKRGKAPKERQGSHLPGGTYTGDALAGAKRELGEETGFGWDDLGVTETTTISPPQLSDFGVQFRKVKVSNVKQLVEDFKRPSVVNPRDEPFTTVKALPIENCWAAENGFSAAYGTDWFADGLQAAFHDYKPVKTVIGTQNSGTQNKSVA